MQQEKLNCESEKIFCCECGETHLFRLKDKENEFILGLQDILRCLRFAEDNILRDYFDTAIYIL